METENSEDVLGSLYDFYSHLYALSDQALPSEMKDFLATLDLPKLEVDMSYLLGPITYKEVESAIKKLCNGKSPGSNGLTAEFYKHFEELLSPVLEAVFNGIFENKSLSFSQCLAIIILLFKKGDPLSLTNYRPISLTNTDYKIIAYILTAYLSHHLPTLIHCQQTAYMTG